MAREWIKITLSYLFLHILAPLHCRERNTRSSRIEAEPCTQVPRQKCALDAHSAPHGMTALPEVQRQQWVGLSRSWLAFRGAAWVWSWRSQTGQKQSLIAPRCRANLLSNFLESPARSATALNCIASASVGFPPSPVR